MLGIALKQLFSDRGKLLTSLVGVVFSVVLVNIQGGLFLGLIDKAGLLVSSGQADIWVGPRGMHNVDFSRDIPRRWVQRIRTVPGVQDAQPYLISFANMNLPSGRFEHVAVVGVERGQALGMAWNLIEGGPEAILQPDGIIVDYYELEKLEFPQLGDIREISGQRARVTGMSRGVMGFLVNPYVFTAFDRAVEYTQSPPDRCSYFLVQVQPGADVNEVVKAIRERVPELDAFSQATYARISVQYWMTRTGLGISFGAATMLGLLVGLVIVAQTLYAMVLDRIAEFGALKAIGADERQIYVMLLGQSWTLALMGSMVGLTLTFIIQQSFDSPRAPILIPWWLALGSCLLVISICMLSSLLPYLRVRKVDPLLVLQG
jgi:putative ABC transport system permease protein